MIELDTTIPSLTALNLSQIENAMKEVDEGVQHFLDRLHLGDTKINYLSLDRLRAASRVAHAEFDAFKLSISKSYAQ